MWKVSIQKFQVQTRGMQAHKKNQIQKCGKRAHKNFKFKNYKKLWDYK